MATKRAGLMKSGQAPGQLQQVQQLPPQHQQPQPPPLPPQQTAQAYATNVQVIVFFAKKIRIY